MSASRFYVRIQGFLLATKAALKKQRCECCYTRSKFIMPAGTTGTFSIGKEEWNVNTENWWPVPTFFNASTMQEEQIPWKYNNLETPTQILVLIGAGTTQVDYHIVI